MLEACAAAAANLYGAMAWDCRAMSADVPALGSSVRGSAAAFNVMGTRYRMVANRAASRSAIYCVEVAVYSAIGSGGMKNRTIKVSCRCSSGLLCTL